MTGVIKNAGDEYNSYEYNFIDLNIRKKSTEEKRILDNFKTECKNANADMALLAIKAGEQSDLEGYSTFSSCLMNEIKSTGGLMSEYNQEIKFMNKILLNKNIKEFYLIEEDISTIWLLLEKTQIEKKDEIYEAFFDFEETLKENINFRLNIFNINQIDQIKNQIKYLEIVNINKYVHKEEKNG